MNAFFNSQFSYCLLIWMCHSHVYNRKINRLHESPNTGKYGPEKSPYLDNFHAVLAIEMFRDSGNLSPSIMNDIFMRKDNSRYNLTQISKFSRPLVKSVYH